MPKCPFALRPLEDAIAFTYEVSRVYIEGGYKSAFGGTRSWNGQLVRVGRES
jgi:hypothetical protein